MFSLKAVECLGSCGTAPMMQCGASYHENLTYEKVDKIMADYKAEGKLKATQTRIIKTLYKNYIHSERPDSYRDAQSDKKISNG